MEAKIEFVRGSITGETYPVLVVNTGRKSLGREGITLKMSCCAYEEDKVKALADIQNIADWINAR